jgi:hypothetical protein
MKRALNLLLGLAVFGLLSITASYAKAYAQTTDGTIVSHTVQIGVSAFVALICAKGCLVATL